MYAGVVLHKQVLKLPLLLRPVHQGGLPAKFAAEAHQTGIFFCTSMSLPTEIRIPGEVPFGRYGNMSRPYRGAYVLQGSLHHRHVGRVEAGSVPAQEVALVKAPGLKKTQDMYL